jgi:hypothetical protein
MGDGDKSVAFGSNEKKISCLVYEALGTGAVCFAALLG